MKFAKPPRVKGNSEFLFWLLAPVLLFVLGLGVWSNHFQNRFHADDFPTLVNNRAVQSGADIQRFFMQPRTFSSEQEDADYKPVLDTSFAIDAWLSRPNRVIVYRLQSFLWFGLLIFSLYFLFRMVPGTTQPVALFGAALLGMHPVAAETVNSLIQRGQIIGAAGVTLALGIWILWSRQLPRKLGLNIDRVPQNWRQEQIRKHGPGWERWYAGFRELRIPFYLIPLIPALFAEPSAAAFALIFLAYVRLYDAEAGLKPLLVPAFVCATYLAVQTAVVASYSPLFRVRVLTWWATEPWVAMRYFYRFFLPGSLSADAGLKPLASWWPPFALAGFAGVGLLTACAIWAGRVNSGHDNGQDKRWRGVAFGIWWFLAALVPTALVPQRDVEATPRMFLAAAGLAFAVAHLGGILLDRITGSGMEPRRKNAAVMSLAAGALAILCTVGWMTYERNQVWNTELSLWLDVTQKNPENARGFINYASALIADRNGEAALSNLQKGVALSADDGRLQLLLAQTFDRLNKDVDTEFHFRRALLLAPQYASAYSYFAQWLFAHRRWDEALVMSRRALALNAADLISRHTLMDLHSLKADWGGVAQLAKEVLALDPDDPAGRRSLTVATASIDQLHRAEANVQANPKVDDYLKLSVLYYHGQRFEDCVKAARGALGLNPNLAEAHANIAAALHAIHRDDEAIVALREVIRLRPDMAFAKTDLDILLDNRAHAPRR